MRIRKNEGLHCNRERLNVKGDVCWWLSHHNPSPTEWKGKYSLDPPPPLPLPSIPWEGKGKACPAHSFHNYAQNM
jgi:hypothetical protein